MWYSWFQAFAFKRNLCRYNAVHAGGFGFHHAEPTYVMLTRWLPTEEENLLPPNASHQVGPWLYSWKAPPGLVTQPLNMKCDDDWFLRSLLSQTGQLVCRYFRVGVGAFITNGAGEVLLVQERRGPAAAAERPEFWKLPTGLVDQGEDIPNAAMREAGLYTFNPV
jgi:hypothetical protein